MVKKITSTRNPLVREAEEIARRKGRPGPGAFVVEGANLVEAAMRMGAEPGARGGVRRVYFTPAFLVRHAGLIEPSEQSALGARIELCEVSDDVMARISDTETPPGAVAIVSYRPWTLGEIGGDGPLVILDALQDPGNVGTVIRTADAAGASGVITLPGTCDPFMPKSLRASAGSIFRVPVMGAEPGPLSDELRAMGVRIIATSPRARQTLYDADLGGRVAFVLGSEGGGVGAKAGDMADNTIRIPMRAGSESLNVSAAAALCLYEWLRRQAAR